MTGIKTYLFLLSLLLSTVTSLAQMQDVEHLGAGKLKNLAKNSERYGDYYTAINYYEKYVQRKHNEASVYHLAELYERVRDYKMAEDAYAEAYEMNNSNIMALYNRAVMEKKNGKPEVAKATFEEVQAKNKGAGNSSDLRRKLRNDIESCDVAIALLSEPLNVEIKHGNDILNGPHAEFSPIPMEGKQLLYGALKEDEIKYYHIDSLTPKRKFYLAGKSDAGSWQSSDVWDVPFNNTGENMANGVFNQDQTKFYFTKCEENWQKQVLCKIWVTKKDGNSWTEPEVLPENINAGGYSSTQPAVTTEPRRGREVLYFVSNRPDGEGGQDIWYSYYDDRKKLWKDPRNLGRRINGAGDEMTPYYNHKQKKLYYSSESFPGVGGLDVFSARGEMRKFNEPENVGVPVNSSVDDLYYVLNDDQESGYFVSNRKGGNQMLNETCCDDIYEFRMLDFVHVGIDGYVMEVDEASYLNGVGDKLSHNAFNSVFLEGVKVDLMLIEDGEEVLMNSAESKATGRYFLDLEPGKEYRLILSKDGYFSNQIDVDTRNITVSDTLFQNIGLSKISENSIVIENILYDFDSSVLTEVAKEKITTGILNTLQENPGIVVEISSHTDNKGSVDYNSKLSQERAESVVQFLIEKGIAASRLVAKGYGETKPIEPNENSDGTDNPEGRKMNRRTEFKIIGQREVIVSEEEEDY